MKLCVVGLFAKSLEGVNVKDLITNVGSSAGAAPAPGGAPAGGQAPAEAKGNSRRILNLSRHWLKTIKERGSAVAQW